MNTTQRISPRLPSIGSRRLATAAFLFASSSHAQGYVLHTFFGTSPGNYEQMGEAVAGAGDLDRDGFADVLIGAIHQANVGRALLHSGRSGTLLRSWMGATLDAHFGTALAAIGDIDGDGVGDVLVGAPSEQPMQQAHQGQARVFSGGSGAQIYLYTGAASLDFFGYSVAAVGDVNRDGVPDFAIGAPGADPGGVREKGEVSIYSGANGQPIRQLQGLGQAHWFGHAVASTGDVDGDGISDLVVGAPAASPGGLVLSGHAHVISAASGIVLRTFSGQAAGDRLGFAVAGTGDFDGDGVADVLVGAPQRDSLRAPVGGGYAVVFSGANGLTLRLLQGRASDGFGYAVAALGDLDGDRLPEIAVGAPWAQVGTLPEAGEARLYSGGSGVPLAMLSGVNAHDFFGASVARAGDVDADGLTDFVVGAPQALHEPFYGPGYARVVSLTGIPAGATVHAPLCAGSGGRELLLKTYGGLPRVGNSAFGTSLQHGLGGGAAALFIALSSAPNGFPIAGCTLYLVPPLHSLATVVLAGASGVAGTGHRLVPLPIPPAAVLAGAQVPLQAAAADPGGPAGWLTLSTALVLTIAP